MWPARYWMKLNRTKIDQRLTNQISMFTEGEAKVLKAHSLTDQQISNVTQTLLSALFSTIQYDES